MFLTSLLLAAAAYAAYQLWKEMQGKSSGGGDGSDKDPGTPPVEPETPISDRDKLIQKVVDGVQFSTTQVVVGQKVLGTEERPSIVPADDIVIRPMHGIGEVERLLPSTQILDDDTFYNGLAANKLLIREDVENVELTEDIMGPPSKALLWLQDISESMEHEERINWSLSLGQRLIDKCIQENARVILIPFNGEVQPIRIAKTAEEAAQLKRDLPYALRPFDGTDIGAAIRAAIDVVKEQKVNDVRMVLVTDGTTDVEEDALDRLRAEHIILHTICIAGNHGQLERFSDKYDKLEDPSPSGEEEDV